MSDATNALCLNICVNRWLEYLYKTTTYIKLNSHKQNFFYINACLTLPTLGLRDVKKHSRSTEIHAIINLWIKSFRNDILTKKQTNKKRSQTFFFTLLLGSVDLHTHMTSWLEVECLWTKLESIENKSKYKKKILRILRFLKNSHRYAIWVFVIMLFGFFFKFQLYIYWKLCIQLISG